MNDILRIAREPEAQELCNRCLGRLFGKLGHYLDNPTRGKALRILLHLEDILGAGIEPINASGKNSIENSLTPQRIEQMIESFEFSQQQMQIICGILKINYDINDIKEREKEFQEYIGSLMDPGIIDDLDNLNSCKVCNDLFDELPKFVELVHDSVKKYEFDNFLIGCKLDIDQVRNEEELWTTLGTTQSELMKSEFNRELGKLVQVRLNKVVDFELPEMTIIVDTRYDSIKLQIGSLFIYGRYRKLVRDLPQTKWPCKSCWGKGCNKCNGTGKIYPTSVEEQIAEKVMEITKGKNHLFHGMGREDIGVRMLGSGRPFILEVTEPFNRNIDLDKLENDINEYTKTKVEVTDLRFSTHREVRSLKAAKPTKTYKVKISLEKKINREKLKDIVSTFNGEIIKQRTPIRVAHRRTDLVRKRKVVDISLSSFSDDGKAAELNITGEGGLYIKELITGDSGRTTPSLTGELNIECIVQELDVLRINDD